MRYINMSSYYISNYVVTLTPYEEINKTVMAKRDPTALFHNISNYDLFVWIHYYAARGTIFPHNMTRGEIDRGTQRELSSKPLKHSIVKRILVFKR